MKKKSFLIVLFTMIAVMAMSAGALAEWKTTKAGTIFTTAGKPGYYTGWHTIGKARGDKTFMLWLPNKLK